MEKIRKKTTATTTAKNRLYIIGIILPFIMAVKNGENVKNFSVVYANKSADETQYTEENFFSFFFSFIFQVQNENSKTQKSIANNNFTFFIRFNLGLKQNGGGFMC